MIPGKGNDDPACRVVWPKRKKIKGESFKNVYFKKFASSPFHVYVSCSVVSDSATSLTVAHQAPLSVGFSRQEYWSGLPFPVPGDLPDPGIEPGSPALQADALPCEPPGPIQKFLLDAKEVD